jgi:predicted nucleic acid-binding Zn ribbon protein
VLNDILPTLKLDEHFAASQATEVWLQVVGPEVAQRTNPVGVRDGELLIEVQGAVWMGHLAILRQGIMEEINAKLPAGSHLNGIRLTPMRCKEGPGIERPA